MSKTIEEIKTQWAKDHSYENYFDFLNLTRKCDTDHVFIMDGAVTQIAKRYAKSQTQELQEQNAELVNVIKDLIPMAEDGYRLHKNNGSHQDFLEDDRDILKKAKELLTKHNHLNKKP